jgi:hypothetical protein
LTSYEALADPSLRADVLGKFADQVKDWYSLPLDRGAD